MDENLRQRLRDRDYRAEFADGMLDDALALQIRTIRESRGLSQKQLGELTGMKQGAISRIERADYGAWSVATLKRIARALDLPLSVRFQSWSEFSSAIAHVTPECLTPPSFADDSLEMRDEYDFSKGVRGKYHGRYSKKHSVVVSAAKRK